MSEGARPDTLQRYLPLVWSSIINLLPVLRDKQTAYRKIISERKHQFDASGYSPDESNSSVRSSIPGAVGSQKAPHRSNPVVGRTSDSSPRGTVTTPKRNFPVSGIELPPRSPSVEGPDDGEFVSGFVVPQPSSIEGIASSSSTPPLRRTSTSSQPFHNDDIRWTVSATSADLSAPQIAPLAQMPRPSHAVPVRTNIEHLGNFFGLQPTKTIERPITVPIPGTSASPSKAESHAGTTKKKKGMFGLAFDFLGSNRTGDSSTFDRPARFSHLGFNSSAGEFSGLLKEWKQLLRSSNISRVASSIRGEVGAVIDSPRGEVDPSGGPRNPVSFSTPAVFN